MSPYRVLITGAASGLGKSVASAFLANNSKVFLIDKASSIVFEGPVTTEFPNKGTKIYHQADVTSEKEIMSAMSRFKTEFGAGPNVIVNCAGVCPAMKVISKSGPHDLNLFANTINVNLIGTFNVIRLALPSMLENELHDGEKGVIINTSSIAGFEGQMGQAAYAASKAGVAGLTLPLARDLHDKQIRCVAIAPGLFETPLLDGLSDKAKASLASNIPFPNRLGLPDEFASLAMHIVTNKYINGEVIRLDGALRMTTR